MSSATAMLGDSLSDTSFLSVGLDIGTTTTHLVISRLTVGPGEDPFGRHHLLDKEIVHRSDIYMTPTQTNGQLGSADVAESIDADAIHEIVLREYASANVRPEQILTGAVIVTGETALKANAESVVQRLAGESSSFAAAVAGANAEGILAGRGSGAAEHSRRHRCCVVNVDIGGGTTNLAWFLHGEPVAAGAIRVGGRHLLAPEQRDSLQYRVVTETARQYLGAERVNFETMRHWIAHCSKLCYLAVQGSIPAPLQKPFLITWPDAPPPRADAIWMSGGVGELMARMHRGETVETDAFDDTGPRLAASLHHSFGVHSFPVQYPADAIRATVIGAGQFSMIFSGETLWADPVLLPLRNLPVMHLPRRLQDLPDSAAIAAAIERERQLRSIDAGQALALALPDLRQADWDAVVQFAGHLGAAAAQVMTASPWVFTMRDNFGRLLGRTLAEQHAHQASVVIDEIDTAGADYIDIGRPVERFKVLIPVVAKTLVFER